jgi:hypothetical protein
MRVVASGGVLYASQPGQLPEDDTVKNGLQTIHRSTDGGHTWERTWKHRKGAEPRSLIGDLLAAADGSLTVYGEGGAWRSADGGRTFVGASGSQGFAGSVTVTALGYLRGEGSYGISADGIHWHSFDLGDGS